jgi:murein DD-endopeptidase MepM/ murein hydrolase activator NlpD
MTKRVRVPVAALAACFFTGIAAGWLLRSASGPTMFSRVVDEPHEELIAVGSSGPGAPAAGARSESSSPAAPGSGGGAPRALEKSSASSESGGPDVPAAGATSKSGASDGHEAASTELIIAPDAIAELRRHYLRPPLEHVNVNTMDGQFGESRAGGARGHEAVDLLAPRNTPVLAVEDGTIAKLFDSKAGGTTIYQFDPTGRFCYYYAHLESYASGLRENKPVAAGETIGYVGTSGNAPKNTPHLHFAIFELTPERRWWKGRPLDPYLVFKK